MRWWLVLLVASHWNSNYSLKYLLVAAAQQAALVKRFYARVFLCLDLSGWNLLGLEKLQIHFSHLLFIALVVICPSLAPLTGVFPLW